MKIILSLLLIIISLFFPGCATQEKINNTILTNSIISMDEFENKYNLSVSNNAGGYLFTRKGVRLQLYPNIRFIRYNSQTIAIPEAPFVTDGNLFIPLSLIDNLPEKFAISEAFLPNAFVILDAGHGGEDTGAISGNIMEKDLALDMVRRIQRGLAANGVKSRLTRNGDYFLTLAQRSDIANKYPGAIFVSIHVNAATSNSAEGIETFFLSSKISDEERGSWAANEYDFNTAEGFLSQQNELTTAINMSKKHRKQGKKLANFIQSKIINNLNEKSRGVKQANFAVLRESLFGPAILVETGFLSHQQTKAKLIKPEYRQAMANCITLGIVDFIKTQN